PSRPSLFPYTTLFRSLSFQQSAVAQEFGDLPTLGDIQNAAGSSQSANADESRKILYGIVGDFGDAPLASAGAADHLMGKLFFVLDRKSTRLNSSHVKI